jgi:hypothetical protein
MFKNPDLSFLFTFFCEGYENLRKIFLYLFLTLSLATRAGKKLPITEGVIPIKF